MCSCKSESGFESGRERGKEGERERERRRRLRLREGEILCVYECKRKESRR